MPNIVEIDVSPLGRLDERRVQMLKVKSHIMGLGLGIKSHKDIKPIMVLHFPGLDTKSGIENIRKAWHGVINNDEILAMYEHVAAVLQEHKQNLKQNPINQPNEF